MSEAKDAVKDELQKLESEQDMGDDEVEEVEIVEDEDAGDGDGEDAGGEEPQYNDQEQAAMQSGWRPKDEWDGDPDEWVDAREFNRRGELLRKIHNQNRQIKQLDGVVNTLANQQKKIFSAGYEKAKRELKSQLREATKEGDDATAEVIENRLEELEAKAREDAVALAQADPKKPEVAPEFVPWVQRNQWFVNHPEMRAYAETIGVQYAQTHPETSNSEVYAYITREVSKRFPEKFGMAGKKTVKKPGSPVEGGDDLPARRGGNGVTRVSLTAEEKSVGRTLVQRGLYKNMNEYAADLKKFGVK